MPHPHLVGEDAIEVVASMKRNGTNMTNLGSISLCRHLIEAGLVDRFLRRLGGWARRRSYGFCMIRVGRQATAVEHLGPSGISSCLVGEIWWVAVAQRWGGGAFAYHRPRHVEIGEARVGIVDVVGLVRALGLVLLGGLMLRRLVS